MKKTINIGVLGCANIAYKAILPTLLELNQFSIQGVASRSKEKADRYAMNFNTKAFYSYEALINPEIVDALYIPLPNSLHYKYVLKALKKGIHVLVEKSMGCNLQEVKELNELAKRKKIVLIENFQFRFHKQFKLIKDLIQSNTIGELRCIRSSFGFPPFIDKDNIRYQANLGGGALLDAGAYPIKITQELLGTNLKIRAAKLHFNKEKGVDTWGGGFIETKDGDLFSEIAFGFDNYYQCNLELWGKKGKILTNRIFTAPKDFETEIIVEVDNKVEKIKVDTDNHFKNMLEYFYILIQQPSLAIKEYEDNIKQAQLLEEFLTIANEK